MPPAPLRSLNTKPRSGTRAFAAGVIGSSQAPTPPCDHPILASRLSFSAPKKNTRAQKNLRNLINRYGQSPNDQAHVHIVLGGDGFMLEVLHQTLPTPALPLFGMNQGTIGFLMNTYRESFLLERLVQAKSNPLNPLRLTVTTTDGITQEYLAFNEVALLRKGRQAAKLAISLGEAKMLDRLICDGIVVATPAGSTAYNLSARGPILPLGCGLIALTPLNPFRPRRWPGALIPARTRLVIEILDPIKRPVSATADFTEVHNIQTVEIAQEDQIVRHLLFDPHYTLEQKVMREQFLP